MGKRLCIFEAFSQKNIAYFQTLIIGGKKYELKRNLVARLWDYR